jgi:DNA anti-recombination protein RmuC
MPTNTEMIRGLQIEVAELRSRVQSFDAIDLRLTKLTDEFNQFARDVAAVKQSVSNLEKQLDRVVNQRFAIWFAIVYRRFLAAF